MGDKNGGSGPDTGGTPVVGQSSIDDLIGALTHAATVDKY
jgi:hypothetical protein